MFHDRDEDVDVRGAIDAVLALRRRAHAGEKLPNADLVTFTRTTTNNRARLLVDREYFLDGVLPAIAAARSSVHVTALFFESGLVGDEVTGRLVEQMQEHPELKVRIIVDGMTFLPGMGLGTNLERLKACGAEIVVHPFFSTMTTQHRKLFVVDGERAFVGGTNLKSNYFASREYQALYKRAVEEGGDAVDRFLEVKERSTDPHAHDCGIEITGPSVAHLQAGFIQNWLQYGRGFEEALDDDDVVKRYFPPAPAASPRPGGATKLTHSVPWGVSQTRAAFADFIRSAKQKLDLEITYIVVPEFVQLLLEAADRGVHVRLVTNSLSSTDFAPAVHELRRIGRRLFDHERIALFETEGYTHVKLAVADERFVLVTTANPERLSWERSFDETLVMDDRDLARSCLTRVLEHDMRDDRSTRLQRGPQTGGWFAFAKQMFWSAVSDLILPVYRHDDERPLPPELQPSANR